MDELFVAIVQNSGIGAVLGYWVWSERKSHQMTLDYYREQFSQKIARLEAKIDSLSEQVNAMN
jgi:hypothetical protein